MPPPEEMWPYYGILRAPYFFGGGDSAASPGASKLSNLFGADQAVGLRKIQ